MFLLLTSPDSIAKEISNTSLVFYYMKTDVEVGLFLSTQS